MVPPAFLALMTTPSIAPSLAEDTWPVSAAGACAHAAWENTKGSAVAVAAVMIDQPMRIVASDGSVSPELGVCLDRRRCDRSRLFQGAREPGSAGAPHSKRDRPWPIPRRSRPQSSGSTLTIEPWWLLPTQNVTGVRRVVDEHAADVGLARQQVFGERAGLGIEPGDAVVEHRAGPDVAVLVDRHVVGRRPGGRHLPFLEGLLLGVEHRDLVAAIEAEPDAVLVVHHAAARRRRLGRQFEQRRLAGLGVDPADVLLGEVGEVDVVMLVRNDVVDVVRLFRAGRALERHDRLDLAGLEVEAVQGGEAVVLRPDLAVGARRTPAAPC